MIDMIPKHFKGSKQFWATEQRSDILVAFQQASELQESTRAAAKTDQIDKVVKVVDPPRRGKPCFRCGRQSQTGVTTRDRVAG